MHPDELVATYQLHAADCIQIAQRMTDPKSRLSLLAMAQSWLKLAEQAVRNSETTLVYETPTERAGLAEATFRSSSSRRK